MRKNVPCWGKKKFNSGKIRKIKETSGRVTEEDPPPRADRHVIYVTCSMKKKKKHSLQVELTEYLIQIISVWVHEMTEQAEPSPSDAWAQRPPLHRGDLEEGRPHKIISSKNKAVKSEEASDKETVKQRRAISSWYGKLISRHLLVYTYCSYRATLSLIRVFSVHLVNASPIFILF